MITNNPIYQGIQRSSGSLWRLTSRLLIGIAGLYILLNLGWFMGISLDAVPEDAYPSGVLGWALLLLIPVPLSIYTVVLTSRGANSNETALISITRLTAPEIVQGYYEGARKRFSSLVTLLMNLAVASAVLPMLIMAVAHIAPVKFVPAIYLPYMIFYINQMNRIGPALGVWMGLRFRDPGVALSLTAAALFGITLPLMALYLVLIINPLLLAEHWPPCLWAGFLVPLAVIVTLPHRIVLTKAERWV
jgi:hypothetical protein